MAKKDRKQKFEEDFDFDGQNHQNLSINYDRIKKSESIRVSSAASGKDNHESLQHSINSSMSSKRMTITQKGRKHQDDLLGQEEQHLQFQTGESPILSPPPASPKNMKFTFEEISAALLRYQELTDTSQAQKPEAKADSVSANTGSGLPTPAGTPLSEGKKQEPEDNKDNDDGSPS